MIRLIGIFMCCLTCVTATLGYCQPYSSKKSKSRKKSMAPKRARLIPTSLINRLEGPYPKLKPVLQRRISPDRCDQTEPAREMRETFQSEDLPKGEIIELRLMRTPGELACSHIEYCHLAVRTRLGWWVTPHDQQQWCSGVVGTGSNVETTQESVEVDESSPQRFLYYGVRVTQSTEVRAPSLGPDGSLRSSKPEFFEVTRRNPFAIACEITSARQIWCQRPYWGVDD